MLKDVAYQIGLAGGAAAAFVACAILQLPVLLGIGFIPCALFGFLMTMTWHNKRELNRSIDREKDNLTSAFEELSSVIQ